MNNGEVFFQKGRLSALPGARSAKNKDDAEGLVFRGIPIRKAAKRVYGYVQSQGFGLPVLSSRIDRHGIF
eukprot:scaffold39784_cov221-Amphora_coffeaeformis.AAC.3